MHTPNWLRVTLEGSEDEQEAQLEHILDAAAENEQLREMADDAYDLY